MGSENFQMYKLDLEKAKEPEIKFPISTGSSKKQESSGKTSTSASLTMLKAFDCVDHKALCRGYIYQKQTSTCLSENVLIPPSLKSNLS